MHLQQKFYLKHPWKILCRLLKSNIINNQLTSSTILHLQPHVLKQALHLLPATSSLQFSEVFIITEGFTEPLSNFVPLGQLFGSVATCLAKCKSTNGQRNGGILEKNQEKQRCSLVAKSEVPLHIFFIKTKVVHCHVELSTG